MTQFHLYYAAHVAASGMDGALDSMCLAAIKKDICAKTYLPCTGMDMNDIMTWNFVDNIMPLPFNRPCKSTCQTVTDICGITPAYLGFSNPDCDQVSDATGLTIYSSDAEECTTTLTNLPIFVASAAEPYIAGEGTYCEGHTSMFYTPISDPLQASIKKSFNMPQWFFGIDLAPLQAPFVAQFLMASMIDFFLRPVEKDRLDNLGLYDGFSVTAGLYDPVSTNRECAIARKRQICGTWLEVPEHQAGEISLYLPDLWTPKMPTEEVCQEYVDECRETSFNYLALSQLFIEGVTSIIVTGDWLTGTSKVYLQPKDVLTYCSRNFAREGNGPPYENTSMFIKAGIVEELTKITIAGSEFSVLKTGNDMSTFIYTDPFADRFGEDEYGCSLYGGYNHPAVTKTKEMEDDPYAVPYVSSSSFEMIHWIPRQGIWEKVGSRRSSLYGSTTLAEDTEKSADEIKSYKNGYSTWSNRVCPEGWIADSCPWNFQDHKEVQMCYASCYYMDSLMDPFRDEAENGVLNQWDQVILWMMFFLMTFMVITWLIFKEKKKQRVVLFLSLLMWLQTFIDLLGYVMYPADEDRYCKNKASPYMHGFNYCAISAMVNLGIVSPMFHVLVSCMALDVYLKVIYSKKNIGHYWQYYVAGSFFVALLFKFIPVFIIGEAAGFDGINACGYSFWLRRPAHYFGETEVASINPAYDIESWQLLLFCLVEHVFWIVSVALFCRIIVEVCHSMKRVHINKNEDHFTNTMKQIRLVKTPVLMILFVSIISALQFIVWDLFIINNIRKGDLVDNLVEADEQEHPKLSLSKNGRFFGAIYFGNYFNLTDMADAQPYLFKFATVDRFTVFMNYYNKLATHLAFPLLLFLVFGLQKDTFDLWKKRLGLDHIKMSGNKSTSSSSSSSSYDWTIVKNNSEMRKFGFSRLFQHSVFESSAKCAPASECENVSSAFESGGSIFRQVNNEYELKDKTSVKEVC